MKRVCSQLWNALCIKGPQGEARASAARHVVSSGHAVMLPRGLTQRLEEFYQGEAVGAPMSC